MARKNYIGYRPTPHIVVVSYLRHNYSNSKLLLECDICHKKKAVWECQLSAGDWTVCEHDLCE